MGAFPAPFLAETDGTECRRLAAFYGLGTEGRPMDAVARLCHVRQRSSADRLRRHVPQDCPGLYHVQPDRPLPARHPQFQGRTHHREHAHARPVHELPYRQCNGSFPVPVPSARQARGDPGPAGWSPGMGDDQDGQHPGQHGLLLLASRRALARRLHQPGPPVLLDGGPAADRGVRHGLRPGGDGPAGPFPDRGPALDDGGLAGIVPGFHPGWENPLFLQGKGLRCPPASGQHPLRPDAGFLRCRNGSTRGDRNRHSGQRKRPQRQFPPSFLRRPLADVQ